MNAGAALLGTEQVMTPGPAAIIAHMPTSSQQCARAFDHEQTQNGDREDDADQRSPIFATS